MTQTLTVTHFDGRHPLGAPATLLWRGREATLIGASVAARYALGTLRVSPRVGAADRFIALPDGGQLQCADGPLLDALPQESRSEGAVAWLERKWGVALVALVALIGGLAALYQYGLPVLADGVAERVPIDYEVRLGVHALQWLDDNKLMQPSKLDANKQAGLREGFARLGHGLPQAAHLQLAFRAAPGIGPNALALPGGTIVLTDELVELSRTPDEVLAVLAHEIGHVERRHALRQLLQGSATAAIAATLAGDAATMSTAVAGFPVLLAQTKYSRDFETEADDYGFRLMKAKGISPNAFADIMGRMSSAGASCGEGESEAEPSSGFLSTHPVTEERIARARAAAQ
jgi:predicted Zn-dependent protease